MPTPDRAAAGPPGETRMPRWSALLRALRESSGVTQDGWAARLGYSRSTVQRWERGESLPDAAAEEALIGVCGERRLFRAFERGPLAGLTVTPELLHDLLAQARSGEAATPSLPPAMARLFDRLRRRFAEAEEDPVATGRPRAQPPRPPPQPSDRPAVRSSFIGREREMADVRALLASTRMLTLTGPGGIGKTRLAVELAETVEHAEDGVWFVRLAPLAEGPLLPATVAAVVGVREEPGRPPIETLTAALAPRTGLLVLDNCEHLVAESAGLAEAILRGCPALRILATSRTPLRVAAETVYRVPPMAVPGSWFLAPGSDRRDSEPGTRNQEPGTRNQDREQTDAVRLFVERATAALPTFRLSAETRPVVAHICRALDGVPLAIELAAARLRILSADQIAARLDERLRLLGGGDPEEPRHETLRAALDWSHDLLTEQERALFRRLSVFPGGCNIEAVEAVCAGDGVERDAVLDLLTQLTDKSLLTVVHGGSAARYYLLETLRQYAAERLAAAGEAERVFGRQLDWALALAERAAPEFRGPEQRLWLDRVEVEHDNLRAVLRRAQETGETAAGLRLAGLIAGFWHARGHLREGSRRLEETLARGAEAPPGVRAEALWGAARLAQAQGNFHEARDFYEGCLVLRREVGDQQGEAMALSGIGGVMRELSRPDDAAAYFTRSLAIFRSLNDQAWLARDLNNLALVADDRGEHERAVALLEECLAIHRARGEQADVARVLHNLVHPLLEQGNHARALAVGEEALALRRALGDARGVARTTAYLGVAARATGDSEQALARFREALGRFVEIGDHWSVAACLKDIAGIRAQQGDPGLAARLWGAAEVIRETLGAPINLTERAAYEESVAAARAALPAPTFTAAWSSGRALSLADAVALARRSGGA